MGRSTSCFKLITCGGDSANKDDLDVSESNVSNDKRGWSFRKKSARHRVLSNTVITEPPASLKKEASESAPLHVQPPNDSVPEKVSAVDCTDEKEKEKSQLPIPVEQPQVPETTTVAAATEEKQDPVLDESAVIVIQTAIRGFLARKELLKLKNLVKLQAAVRGHLVRRHAVGTLRCVQAIVKMQVLVRARRAQLSSEAISTESKPDEKENCTSKTSVKLNSVKRPDVTYKSVDKLLTNKFARQLMESTSKKKPIHIKCDPAKQDSAWNWLERWMSVSSEKQVAKPESTTEEHGKISNEFTASAVETRTELLSDSVDSKLSVKESVELSESEENLITYDADKFNFQQSQPTSPTLRDDPEPSQPENSSNASNVREILVEATSHQNQIRQSDEAYPEEIDSLSSKPEIECEQTQPSTKRVASENLETDGKKLVLGPRKASNPAFIAAQSKFEELSSTTTNSGRSMNITQQDVSVGSNVDMISSGTEILSKPKELGVSENLVPHFLKIHNGGSECGTELSISSTLDSPDRSEVGTTECERENKVSEKETCDDSKNSNHSDIKATDASGIDVSDVPRSVVDIPEKVDAIPCESVETPEEVHKPQSTASDILKEPESEGVSQTNRTSPEASPKSHITVPESHGTPSSEASVKAKKNRTGKSQKRKSLSLGKGSPSKPNHDSGARNSTELLPKDQKNGKRRNSFGSTKNDNIDQEPGDRSSSNSIPHFMQATESARAKLQANSSPRSSPDMQDREIYVKKRHSLPATNGRQVSPRIQRSTSQAQQGTKGNERKWQR